MQKKKKEKKERKKRKMCGLNKGAPLPLSRVPLVKEKVWFLKREVAFFLKKKKSANPLVDTLGTGQGGVGG